MACKSVNCGLEKGLGVNKNGLMLQSVVTTYQNYTDVDRGKRYQRGDDRYSINNTSKSRTIVGTGKKTEQGLTCAEIVNKQS